MLAFCSNAFQIWCSIVAAIAVVGFGSQTSLAGSSPSSDRTRLYRQEVRKERQEIQSSKVMEDIYAGSVALGIGLYGYYNDRRGVTTRVVYSTTQTAGVFVISGALGRLGKHSALLESDQHFRRHGRMSYRRFRHITTSVKGHNIRIERRQRAYTSAVIAGLYSFNAYRERRENPTLSSVFYFLGANFALVSAANFYQLAADDNSRPGVAFSPFPYPTVAFRF